MATGPQKIPFASTAYWYGSKYPGTRFEANVGVVHTTEGPSLPDYGGGASAPNVTAVPDFAAKKLRWYQHFDVDESSRALRNLSGGVETNTLNSFQIELVGTCDPSTHKKWTDAGYKHIFWPQAPDWALEGLAELVRWLADNHKIQMKSTVTWKAYPSSYGNSSVRLSGAEWQNYYGWLGHQHVPENDHGDPGNIDFARVLQFAKGETPAEEEEEDMALSAEDIKKVAAAVWAIHMDDPLQDGDATVSVERSLHGAAARLKRVEDRVNALAVSGVDLDALAVKVADEIYKRMAG